METMELGSQELTWNKNLYKSGALWGSLRIGKQDWKVRELSKCV